MQRFAFVAAAVVGLLIIRQTDPADSSWLPPCPLHWLTGWHCPGCGATRALHALLHGELGEAFWQNPLLVSLAPAVLALCLWHWATRGSATVWTLAVPPAGIWLALFVLIAFGVLRNLPFYPFHLLAPH